MITAPKYDFRHFTQVPSLALVLKYGALFLFLEVVEVVGLDRTGARKLKSSWRSKASCARLTRHIPKYTWIHQTSKES
jgi:hypothetical protein